MAAFQKIGVQSTVDKIVNQIIELIIAGTLVPGQRIPTESDLANTLEVGRNSVREAVKILCAYGILEIRRADGTYVCSSFSPKLINPFIYGIILEKDPCNLIELRDAIENYVYLLAAEKVTEEDLVSLKEVLDHLLTALNDPNPDMETIAELDGEFHVELSKCGHNPILTQINSIVCLLLHKSRKQTIENMINNGKKEFLIDIHKKSYQAILDHDLDNITDISHESIYNWSEFVMHQTDSFAAPK